MKESCRYGWISPPGSQTKYLIKLTKLLRIIRNNQLLTIINAGNYFMIPVSKGQKAIRACTIRLLNLGHVKYEKEAIYAVNQRISNI